MIILVVISISLIVSAFMPTEPKLTANPEKISIAVIMRTINDDYWRYLQRGADSAARDSNAQITFYAPDFDGDIEGQLKIANSVLESFPDVIILGANADEPFSEFLVKANNYRIPIIAVDSLLTSGTTASYIGSNNFAAGQQAMDEIAQFMGEKGNLLIVNYTFGGINAKLRKTGVLEQLKLYDQIQLARTIECSSEVEHCKDTIKWVYENESIDGVVALMTNPTLASALALKETQLEQSIHIVGFDSSNALLELLQEGQMQTLFVQNPFTQGYLAVKQAVEIAGGKLIPNYTEMPMTKINSENMFWLQNQKLLFPVVN